MCKAIYSIFFILLGLNSFAQKNNPARLIAAESKAFVGGVVGSTQQERYFLAVVIPAKYKAVFDTLWIENAALVVNKNAASGDTLQLFATHSWTDAAFLAKNRQSVPAPIVKWPKKAKGQGLLSYTLKHKRYFLQIKTFKRQEPVNYPAAPPMPSH